MPTVQLRAPPGKFRVVGVDTFDRTNWVHGDYDSKEAALAAARSLGGEMLKAHTYDDAGRHLEDFGRF